MLGGFREPLSCSTYQTTHLSFSCLGLFGPQLHLHYHCYSKVKLHLRILCDLLSHYRHCHWHRVGLSTEPWGSLDGVTSDVKLFICIEYSLSVTNSFWYSHILPFMPTSAAFFQKSSPPNTFKSMIRSP